MNRIERRPRDMINPYSISSYGLIRQQMRLVSGDGRHNGARAAGEARSNP